MMYKLYYHKDSKRGALGTYERLLDEMKELGEALNLKDKEVIENEFADVIAWLASLANVVGIPLESATVKKYNWRCPKCQQSPCQCPL
jgi:NTP pyrophosphatase (non-canonical NTP hydrolase)